MALVESPIAVLFNVKGQQLAVTQSQPVSASQPGLVVMASGSTGWQALRLSPNGDLFVTGSVTTSVATALSLSLSVSYFPLTQSVSVVEWRPNVTASVFVLNPTATTQSVKLDQWSSNVTGAVTIVGSANFVGSVSVSNFPVTQSTSEVYSQTTALSATNATSGLVGYSLLGTNLSRKGATFFLEGQRVAYMKLGLGADVNSFSTRMNNGGYWEVPYKYVGPVTCTFLSGAGSATLYQTELT